MKNKIVLIYIAIFLMCSAVANAQESSFGNWLIYIGNKKIDNKWSIHHEVQYRNYDAIGDLEQLLLRAGLGYNLSDKDNVLLGYGFIRSENYLADNSDKFIVNEHRIFQQFITKHNFKKLNFTHRYRFEQRFIEKDFRIRFRYFLSLSHPLFQIGESSKTIYLSSYNEIFLNGDSSIFDRNRLYGGLGVKLSKNLKIEAGYMNQFFETSSRDQFNIITFLNF